MAKQTEPETNCKSSCGLSKDIAPVFCMFGLSCWFQTMIVVKNSIAYACSKNVIDIALLHVLQCDF